MKIAGKLLKGILSLIWKNKSMIALMVYTYYKDKVLRRKFARKSLWGFKI